MFAGLVRPPKALAGGVVLTAALLCWAPVSQAAVFTGSATDPPGDLGLDIGDDLPSPAVDFTHVSVRYDDVAGRVDVVFHLQSDSCFFRGATGERGAWLCGTRRLLQHAELVEQDLAWPNRRGRPPGSGGREGHFVGIHRVCGGQGLELQRGSFRPWLRRGGLGRHGVVRLAWHPAKDLELRDHSSVAGRQALQMRARRPGALQQPREHGVGDGRARQRCLRVAARRGRPAFGAVVESTEGQTVSGKLTERGAGAHKCEAKIAARSCAPRTTSTAGSTTPRSIRPGLASGTRATT